MSTPIPTELPPPPQPATSHAVAVTTNSDETTPNFSVFNAKANRKIHQEFVIQQEHYRTYISELENLLNERGIEIPEDIHEHKKHAEASKIVGRGRKVSGLMEDGSLSALSKAVERTAEHAHRYEIHVQYRNLTFWNMVPKKKIPTVGSSFLSMIVGSGKKHRVNIINDLTGRILPKRMTLVMGPPGCGKTTFLKALAGQLTVGKAHLEGDILYNGDSIDSGKYLIGKVATYADEKEQHAPTLTVRETMEFAWKMTTGGHHSYGVARDKTSAEFLDKNDKELVLIKNMLKVLGLYESADTLVGDGMIRGISGGQKRRVTLGEMLLPPRRIKFLDAISNGLDAATTYDIVQALKFVTNTSGLTTVISLLQPAPDVFYSFTDVIVMADGQIIYHGLTTKVLEYFNNLGYHCPEIMDVADFLQDIPTPDGRRFTAGKLTIEGGAPPVGTDALVKAWKESEVFKTMLVEMDEQVFSASTKSWPPVYNERYPSSYWYTFTHCLQREATLLMRNTPFLKGRIMQVIIVGIIAGTLFSNLPTADTNSMSGILYFSALFGALSAMSMLPIIFEQRAVFYKHSKSLFYPTWIYVLAQTLVMYPLMITETVLSSTIVYWSVGLSDDYHGSRFFTYMFVVWVFALVVSQLFRLLAGILPSAVITQPFGGVALILMVLFSGFIVPKSNIPPGWEWFYWINPMGYVLKAVTVNEFMAPDYDYLVCADAGCSSMERFGNQVLNARGNPTDQKWVWYSVAVMIGIYLFLLSLTILTLTYFRIEPVPPAPIVVDYTEELAEEVKAEKTQAEIPYDPVTFAFKDIWYTVTLPNGEDLDLLRGVSGYFEPGTVTALMGSSGAGKTTLLDVLSGRKNTGEIKGGIFVNGKPVEKHAFRHMMGYVEQFDTLAPNDTAREAIEFSAALRLPGDTPADIRAAWVSTVLTLLELDPLENTMIGNAQNGGMSFEQKKRVSIGVELAANPAILFLDEPTTGLDSRAAQVVIRCIKRMAASGRSIVCTIHQPSAVIFDSFESLLLLRRGGQTVYFGELGEGSKDLVTYFESLPGVRPITAGTNPATWMLEVIGAGTGNTSAVITDFHACYKQSGMCEANETHVDVLCPEAEDEGEIVTIAQEGLDLESGVEVYHQESQKLAQHVHPSKYNASYWVQFTVLMKRFLLSYWRSPTYNVARMIVNVVIALIFSSTYADQKYSTNVDVISRVALIYVTVLFMGVVGCNSVQPVVFADRPAFYREQFSEIYDVKIYTLCSTLVEIPYLLISSIVFVIPYFWIVGFDKDGTTDKFFWYWLYQCLYITAMVFLGHFLASGLPNQATCAVIGGMLVTFISLFGGFMIKAEDFPDFWIFMYWLDPLHYVVEGLVVTQFHGDHTPVSIIGTAQVETAASFVSSFYADWRYSSRGFDIMALCLYIIVFRLGTYLCLEYVRHDKR